MQQVRIATRGSRLALWQAEHIAARIKLLQPECHIHFEVIKTKGDVILDVPLAQLGGKGLFVKEIEEALLNGSADIAVHSMKDLPMHLPEELTLACVPAREEADDCLLSLHYDSLEQVPPQALLGTSSLRRQAQLLHLRPDLRIVSLRGNVDTRLRKLHEGQFDAIILASAGVKRLGLIAPRMSSLAPPTFLPAVGQGALGIECRSSRQDLLSLLSALDDRPSRICVEAERAFLAGLDGGCQVPIAGHATMIDQDNFLLEGLVAELDGTGLLRAAIQGTAATAAQNGQELAKKLLEQGAAEILERLYAKNL